MECVWTSNLLRRLADRTNVFQQCRFYRPIKLRKNIVDRLDRVRKPFIPTESDKPELVLEWQKHPYVVKMYKQKAWAKFGSASGVDLASILPTKKELEEEWESEKEWWPTLQEMKENIKKKKGQEKAEKEAREKKIAENLSKMPKWIEQWQQENKKAEERGKLAEIQKEERIARIMEKTNYSMDRSSKEFKSLIQQEIAEERILKKKFKKEAKLKKGT